MNEKPGLMSFLIRLRVYGAPFPVWFAMWWAWCHYVPNRAFVSYVMLLPVVYGYVMPGIATNVLRRWRFKGPWVVGGFYAHHGFMYAANMTPLLFVSFLGTPITSWSWDAAFRIALSTAGLNGFFSWLSDIWLVKESMVEICNSRTAIGKSAEEIVTNYAPVSFFLIGLTYALGGLIAFHRFVIQERHAPNDIALVWTAGAALLFTIPSIAYRILEGRSDSSTGLSSANEGLSSPSTTGGK